MRMVRTVFALAAVAAAAHAQEGLMDPALQKLSELPCSDSLPRILLTYADYLDCAESGKAQGDKHKGCDEPLSAMLKKIGDALKTQPCYDEMRHFLKDNIAAADFTGVMNTMAGYGDCVAANAMSQCIADMDKSWVALADALTSDIDERPRATVLDLDKSRRKLSACLGDAPLLYTSLSKGTWEQVRPQVATLSDAYRELAAALAQQFSEKAQTVVQVYYQQMGKSGETSVSGDFDAHALLPHWPAEAIVDPRACADQWLELKAAILAAAGSNDAMRALSMVLGRLYFLGNAKDMIMRMIQDNPKQLLDAHDCLFTFKSAKGLTPCLNQVATQVVTLAQTLAQQEEELTEDVQELPANGVGHADDSEPSAITYIAGTVAGVVAMAAVFVVARRYGRYFRGGNNVNDIYRRIYTDDDDEEGTSMADFLGDSAGEDDRLMGASEENGF